MKRGKVTKHNRANPVEKVLFTGKKKKKKVGDWTGRGKLN